MTREDGYMTACTLSFGFCVGVKIDDNTVSVKDTKDENGAVLNFSKDEWATFIGGVKDGTFDV
jgi:hypothetical protein